jgi:hypothetical protein
METDLYALDPRYEEEVSGCTASVGILSSKKIYVVGDVILAVTRLMLTVYRVMLEILEAFWG